MPSQASFDMVSLQDDLKANTVEFPMDAVRWKGFATTVNYAWTRVKFEAAAAPAVPADKRGLYCFVVEPAVAQLAALGFPMYVGMVEKANRSFRDRFNEYLSEPAKLKPRRPRIVRMIMKFPDQLYFYYAPMAIGTDIAGEEDQLIRAILPPVNDNVPAEVRDVVKAF